MAKTAEPIGVNESNVVLATGQYEVVGTRPIRHDGVDKVTGRAIYGPDFRLPGTLYGRIVRSPHAHARIKSIDTRRAEALPGVRAVVTARDLPSVENKVEELGESSFELQYLKDTVLASDKVLYKGHAVAAVAADSPHTAEEAAKLIAVEYEVLPPVMDVLEAAKEDAVLLHENMITKSLAKPSNKPSNIARHIQHRKGDPDKGFAEADVIVEREVRTATVHQGYIEPHNVTALWNADGQLTIWCSTQGAFGIRSQLAEVLRHPIARIKVVPLEIGGGFGAKFPVFVHVAAALLSQRTGRPVKIVMSRSEEFQATNPTPGSYIKTRIGATRDGRITAATVEIYFEAGAYPGSPVGAACITALAPYDVPNGQIDGYDVLVNKPRSGAYRAPGATQAAFAVEVAIDELAEKLGMDPLEFRLKNAAREGTRRVDGPVFPRIGCAETVEAARSHAHYLAPLEGPNRGRGVASGFWMNGAGQSSCVINVNDDGTVRMIEGSVDIGGTRASIAMQAAEILGIDAHDVRPFIPDTDSIGYTDGTGGSRTTFATGWAAIEAAEDVIRQMCQRAARIWEVDPSTVTYEEKVFTTSADPSKRFTFRELAALLPKTGGRITGQASSQHGGGQGGAFATHIVDVEVDPETGKVQILRYTAVQDAGKAIHPSYVEGQMQGGVAQGVGWALHEGYTYNEQGAMLNTSWLDYRMPTSLDLPMIDTVIVEVPNPGHPFGVRGVGEVPIVPPPAAIANAIYRAVGVRLNELPMTPERIVKALGSI